MSFAAWFCDDARASDRCRPVEREAEDFGQFIGLVMSQVQACDFEVPPQVSKPHFRKMFVDGIIVPLGTGAPSGHRDFCAAYDIPAGMEDVFARASEMPRDFQVLATNIIGLYLEDERVAFGTKSEPALDLSERARLETSLRTGIPHIRNVLYLKPVFEFSQWMTWYERERSIINTSVDLKQFDKDQAQQTNTIFLITMLLLCVLEVYFIHEVKGVMSLEMTTLVGTFIRMGTERYMLKKDPGSFTLIRTATMALLAGMTAASPIAAGFFTAGTGGGILTGITYTALKAAFSARVKANADVLYYKASESILLDGYYKTFIVLSVCAYVYPQYLAHKHDPTSIARRLKALESDQANKLLEIEDRKAAREHQRAENERNRKAALLTAMINSGTPHQQRQSFMQLLENGTGENASQLLGLPSPAVLGQPDVRQINLDEDESESGESLATHLERAPKADALEDTPVPEERPPRTPRSSTDEVVDEVEDDDKTVEQKYTPDGKTKLIILTADDDDGEPIWLWATPDGVAFDDERYSGPAPRIRAQ